MFSENSSGKASKGSVRLKISNDRIQLVFTVAGKRHYISTGLADTPANRKVAERKAAVIEDDIFKERFDPTLQKYKPQSALTTVTPIFTPTDEPPKTSLLDLWNWTYGISTPNFNVSIWRRQPSCEITGKLRSGFGSSLSSFWKMPLISRATC